MSDPDANSVRLRVRFAPRDADRFPQDDDEALGRSLFGMLDDALDRGLPRPAFLVIRPDQVDQVDALPLLRMPRRRGQRLMAALAGQDDVQCVALVAPLTVRTGPSTGARAAVVFVEWPDNRWWTAWQPLDDSRILLGEGPAEREAADGWPKPGGVGGWFAAARRHNLKIRMTPTSAQGEPTTVH